MTAQQLGCTRHSLFLCGLRKLTVFSENWNSLTMKSVVWFFSTEQPVIDSPQGDRKYRIEFVQAETELKFFSKDRKAWKEVSQLSLLEYPLAAPSLAVLTPQLCVDVQKGKQGTFVAFFSFSYLTLHFLPGYSSLLPITLQTVAPSSHHLLQLKLIPSSWEGSQELDFNDSPCVPSNSGCSTTLIVIHHRRRHRVKGCCSPQQQAGDKHKIRKVPHR